MGGRPSEITGLHVDRVSSLATARMLAAVSGAKLAALADRVTGRAVRRQIRVQRKAYYQDFWIRVAERGGGEIDDIGGGFSRIRIGQQDTMVRSGFVALDNMVVLKFAKDKNLVEDLLVTAELPVTRGMTVGMRNWRDGLELLGKHPSGLVVKPVDGSGGKGVTTAIKSENDYMRALSLAWAYSRKVRVEPFAEGESYRLLFVRGKLVDTIKRQSPTVVGDGRSTVKTLLERENSRRAQDKPCRALSRLSLDLDANICLADQGHSSKSIPAQDEIVRIKNAVNQNNRNENSRVLSEFSEVHDCYLQAGARIFELTGIAFLGLDFITTSITEDYRANGGVINEINTTPALHHHDLVDDGDGVDIGLLALQEAMWADSRWWENDERPQIAQQAQQASGNGA